MWRFSMVNSTSTYVPVHMMNDKFLSHHIDILTIIDIKIDKYDLPSLNWLPNLHKNAYNRASYQFN